MRSWCDDAKSGEDLTRSILLQIIPRGRDRRRADLQHADAPQIIRFYGHAMQGHDGFVPREEPQTFTDIQQRIAEQSKGLYDPKAMNPELWTQFLQGQAPAMQGLMGNYLEQSKAMFMQMQEQMTKQAETLFPAYGVLTAPAQAC